MKQYRFRISKIRSNRFWDYLPPISFVIIALLLYETKAFPSLYGDEYRSLVESHNLLRNLHAIGYFSQLNLWSSISQSDWFLRVLSLGWFGAGIFWLNEWLKIETLQPSTRKVVVWLSILNPFLWIYGIQIRFYAMFFATSVLFIWRFRAWQLNPARKNQLLLILGVLLVITSHFFGLLVVATTLINSLWTRLGKRRWILLVILVLSTLMAFTPPIRSFFVAFVFRFTNPYANIPSENIMRGISLAKLAKVPLTFYFFSLGERIYPLWLRVTIPAIVSFGLALSLGVWRFRSLRSLSSLVFFMLLNIPLVFLILDPLAPPGLQGAAPRYLIYVIPYFLIFIAAGAESWKPLKYILIIVSIVGLFFLAKPSWSYDSSNLVNWPKILQTVITLPTETCVVTDGRALGPVNRYSPIGTIVVNWDSKDCLGYSRVILITDDFRLSMVRNFDQIAEKLSKDYTMVSNQTLFPEQITVFDKSQKSEPYDLLSNRVDLTEQDLRFPLTVQNQSWTIPGFVRLDEKTPSATLKIEATPTENFWALTNYLTDKKVKNETPIFSLDIKMKSGENKTVLLRSGHETAGWEGICDQCSSMYSWVKKISLVGTYYYPGAYRQYTAHIWGSPIKIDLEDVSSVGIKYLLSEGTGYFYGIYPLD